MKSTAKRVVNHMILQKQLTGLDATFVGIGTIKDVWGFPTWEESGVARTAKCEDFQSDWLIDS